METTREKLLKVMGLVRPGADFESCPDLIKEGVLDSLMMVMLTMEIESSFGVKISPLDIVPDNFRTVDSICSLIDRLMSK